MVLVQVNIKDTLDKKLKHYMIDNDQEIKAQAIVELVEIALDK